MAAEIDRAFIHQASETHGGGHLLTAELHLMVGQPDDILFVDHTDVQGLEEKLAYGHGCM